MQKIEEQANSISSKLFNFGAKMCLPHLKELL